MPIYLRFIKLFLKHNKQTESLQTCSTEKVCWVTLIGMFDFQEPKVTWSIPTSSSSCSASRLTARSSEPERHRTTVGNPLFSTSRSSFAWPCPRSPSCGLSFSMMSSSEMSLLVSRGLEMFCEWTKQLELGTVWNNTYVVETYLRVHSILYGLFTHFCDWNHEINRNATRVQDLRSFGKKILVVFYVFVTIVVFRSDFFLLVSQSETSLSVRQGLEMFCEWME